MNEGQTFRRTVSLFLALTLLFTQTTAILAAMPVDEGRRLAFLGIHGTHLSQDIRDDLSNRFLRMFSGYKGMELLAPAGLDKGAASLLLQVRTVSDPRLPLLRFCEDHQLQALFWADIDASATDTGDIQLQGELLRYDATANELLRFPVNTRYVDFGNLLVEFQRDVVQPMMTKKKSIINIWPLLGIAALVILTSAAFKTGVVGGRSDNRPPDTQDH